MQDVHELVITKTKHERQSHIDLSENCIERGGCSTNHKGVLAQYLETTIPNGKKAFLCHACNNENCSNPKHLYWGTPKENVQDAINCGTFYAKGSKKGWKQSDEAKAKISRSLTGRPSNNQHGVNGISAGTVIPGFRYTRKYKQIWITDGVSSTRIPADSEIPSGWKRGRIFVSGWCKGSTSDFDSGDKGSNPFPEV